MVLTQRRDPTSEIRTVTLDKLPPGIHELGIDSINRSESTEALRIILTELQHG